MGPSPMYPNLQQSLNDLHLNSKPIDNRLKLHRNILSNIFMYAERNSSGSIVNEQRPFGSVPNSPAYNTTSSTSSHFPLNKQYNNATTLSQMSGIEGKLILKQGLRSKLFYYILTTYC